MKPFVITVDFRLRAGRMAEFLPLMIENANASKTREPGCRQFDVLIPREGGDWVRLYELYDSKAAFDEHLKAAHFLAFREATREMIEKSTIEQFDMA